MFVEFGGESLVQELGISSLRVSYTASYGQTNYGHSLGLFRQQEGEISLLYYVCKFEN